MPVLVRDCQLCGVRPTPSDPLSTCGRCQVVLYCCRAHQQEDFSAHKNRCIRAKQCYELVASEEAALRTLAPSDELPENVFDEGEGMFWLIRPTRPFMSAKYELIHTLAMMDSHAAMTVGLSQAMHALRLSRSDNIGVREIIPAMMLSLGQVRECYDFIKWYVTCDPDGTYEWSNPEAPFLTVKDADITESVACFKEERSPFFLGALAYIKLMQAKQMAACIQVHGMEDQTKAPAPIVQALHAFLATVPGEPVRTIEHLQILQTALAQQAEEAFALVHKRNPHYWRSMLDPMPLAREPEPPHYAYGSKYQIQIWLMPNARLWVDDRQFIAHVLQQLHP